MNLGRKKMMKIIFVLGSSEMSINHQLTGIRMSFVAEDISYFGDDTGHQS